MLKKSTRRLKKRISKTRKVGVKGGGKGHKPGMPKHAATSKAARASAAAAAGGEGAEEKNNSGAGAGAAAGAAGAVATRQGRASLCLEKSLQVIHSLEESWKDMVESQRETRIIMVKSIDGLKEDGQFYITAWSLPSPEQTVHDPKVPIRFPVVVGAPFIKHPGEKKAKIACPELLKEGAAILVTVRQGRLVGYKEVVAYAGKHQVSQDVMKNYFDLIAVFPDDLKKEWLESGKLKASTRW